MRKAARYIERRLLTRRDKAIVSLLRLKSGNRVYAVTNESLKGFKTAYNFFRCTDIKKFHIKFQHISSFSNGEHHYDVFFIPK